MLGNGAEKCMHARLPQVVVQRSTQSCSSVLRSVGQSHHLLVHLDCLEVFPHHFVHFCFLLQLVDPFVIRLTKDVQQFRVGLPQICSIRAYFRQMGNSLATLQERTHEHVFCSSHQPILFGVRTALAHLQQAQTTLLVSVDKLNSVTASSILVDDYLLEELQSFLRLLYSLIQSSYFVQNRLISGIKAICLQIEKNCSLYTRI